MDNSVNNLDCTMDYQENNSEQKMLQVPNTISSNNDYEKSSHFVAPKVPKLNDDNTSALVSKIDLKTCDFDDLLINLSNNVICRNIRAIYNFLKGKNDVLEFRGVNKFMEEILVRIVRNVDVLQSQKFNRHCMHYCNLIIDLLKNAISNKIFMVACIYMNETDYIRGRPVISKLLVYKKLFYTSNYELQIEMMEGNQSVQSIVSMSSTPPISPSTSVESLDSQRSNFNTKPPSANHFISHCLHLMLNFVKDETQLSLEFSGLDNEDTIYLHSILSSVIDESFDNGTLGKKVYRALWEAIKIFSLKFEFRIRNLKSSLDTKSLLLEKHIRIHESYCTDVTDETSMRRATKRKLKKSTKKHQAFINQLSPNFIMQCLKKMLSFLSDESEASVIIAVSTPEEKKFAKNIINFCRSPNIKSIFDDEPRRILEELNELMDKTTNYRLRTSGKNKCGHNDVKYMKIPLFDNPPQQKTTRPCSTVDDRQPSTSSTVCEAVSTESKKLPRSNINFQSAGVMDQKVKNEDSSVLNCERDPVLTEMMLKYVTPDNKILQMECNVQHPKPKQPQLRQIDEAMKMMVGMSRKDGILGARGNGITERIMPHLSSLKPVPSKLRGKEGRKDQLIEALSVPVQIDKAVKMMVGMGWKGGALGARGNGITEPIMPHLSSGSGAGFGHINLQKLHIKLPKAQLVSNNKRSPHKFRELFLNSLLTLLTSSEDSKTVNLPLMLNKKEQSFLRHTINTFARRSKVKMEGDLQVVIDKIEAQYAKDPKMAVTACVSTDRRQLVLTKIHVLEPLHLSDAVKKQRIAMADTMTDNVKEFMDNYGPLFFSQESLEESTFRVRYLLQVLKLVKHNSLCHIVMDFDTAVTVRQKNLLNRGIMHINNKKKFGDSPEAALSTEIRKFMGCYKLSAKFNEEYTSLTISKEYLNPSSAKGAYIENDDDFTENDEKINENKNALEDKDKMSETEDNIKVDVDSYEDDDILIKKESETNKSENYDMDHDEIKTETDNRNTQSSQKRVTIENSDAIVKVESNDNATSKYTDETDEIIKEAMYDDNENKLNTSSINEYSTDGISISDPSGFTANLDYSETEDSDICDDKLSDDKLKSSDKRMKLECDKLGLSLKSVTSKTALNVDLGEQSQTENKSDVKIVYLTKNYSFSKDTPKYIQGLISFNIIKKKELPLLECHGVHNNALIYSCHTKESYDWLQNICIANEITIFTKEVDKMSLKINSFLDFDDKYLFNLLELYNKEISTTEWSVLKKEKIVDCVVFEVEMDKKSVKFILDSNLALYAGVDKVTFSIIWE